MLRVLLPLGFALILLTADRPVAAEEFDPYEQPRLFLLRDTNEARDAITSIRELMAEDRVEAALRQAQVVLDEMTEDYFLVAEASQPEAVVWRAATEVVRDFLAALSPEHRERYAALTRPNASLLLDQAARDRDTNGLRELVMRFGATPIGREAARLLAEIHLEGGAYRDAAYIAAEAIRFAPRDAGLWYLRIEALRAAEDRAGLQRLDVPTELTAPGNASAGDGAPLLLATLRDQAQQELGARPPSRDWPMWSGRPDRARIHSASPPLARNLRFENRLEMSMREEDGGFRRWRVQREISEFRRIRPNVRAMFPVVRDRVVYVADGRSVQAFDLYSARHLWRYGAGEVHAETDLQLVDANQIVPGRTSLERAFSPVATERFVVATVEEEHDDDVERLQHVRINTYIPQRTLVVLDRNTGRRVWYMGQRGMQRLSMRDASIVAPPVVVEDMVIALASHYHGGHNLSLVALDLATGTMRWQRRLGVGQQELNLFGYPVKELAGSTIAVADNVAYVSTSVGFVAAVDIRQGRVRWVSSYETLPIDPVEYWYRMPLRIPHVGPSPPVVADKYLVVAPTDARYVYVYERATGQIRWRAQVGARVDTRPQGYTLCHFLGIHGDGEAALVITAEGRLVARSLASGEVVWMGTSDGMSSGVIGRGLIAEDQVLVPTASGLMQFSIPQQGKLLGETPWPSRAEPGNLLAMDRVLLVAGENRLQWFYDWDDLARDVRRRRAERPNDPSILVEAGELFLRAGGEPERAREAFREAIRLAGKADQSWAERARRGLFVSWIQAAQTLRTVPAQADKALSRAREHAATAEERVTVEALRYQAHREGSAAARIRALEYIAEHGAGMRVQFVAGRTTRPGPAQALLLLADEEEDRGQVKAALAALQRLLEEHGDTMLDGIACRELARDQIAEVIQVHGRAAYAAYERKAREAVEQARGRSDGAQALAAIIRRYPNAEIIPQALMALAERRLSDGRPEAAIAALRDVMASQAAEADTARALALLVRAYMATGARGGAALAMQRLAQRYKDTSFRFGGRETTGGAVAQAQQAALQQTPAHFVSHPEIQAPLFEQAFIEARDEATARYRSMELEEAADGRVEEAPLSLVRIDRDLIAIDMATGREAWRAPYGLCAAAAYTDQMVIVVENRQLRGLRARDGEQAWELPLHANGTKLVPKQGVVFAYVPSFGSGRPARLFAVDASTGSILWERNVAGDNVGDLDLVGGLLALEQARTGRTTTSMHLVVFDPVDGRRLHRIELHPGTRRIALSMNAGPLVVMARMLRSTGTGMRNYDWIAYDVTTGQVAWTFQPQIAWEERSTADDPSARNDRPTALGRDGDTLLALYESGDLVEFSLADGTQRHHTRIYLDEAFRRRPLIRSFGISQRYVAFAPARSISRSRGESPPILVCYERKTGKLAWRSELPEGILTEARSWFAPERSIWMVRRRKAGQSSLRIRVIDHATGETVQDLMPEGHDPRRSLVSTEASKGTLVLVSSAGVSIYRRKK